ncbi:T9SS type A sorting domain-containing protein [Stygiobacter electus]|uniref:T9SS type A sorting domain-containing protein n=1 Tax=Stygiobacter electus TaxID=3032292 RepID=A0AAE3P2E3_9BACT|nr:T9SS type A sorting domain-containing protein [Stygiobacter electus]MDF1612834.1 T9SS type A sorting domain-containing protein [Stygiobacter electus]
MKSIKNCFIILLKTYYRMKYFYTTIFILINSSVYAQFIISPGLYTLGTADKTTPENIVNLPFIDGVVIRTKWETVEKQPGLFDWTYIDSEVNNAKKFGKKSVIQILGSPAWIRDSLNAQVYFYIDQNKYHPTFGDTLFGYIPWDNIYLQRVKNLITALGAKYAADTNIAYINAVSGSISRNLPEKIADGRNFWEVFDYNPDTLIAKLCSVLDVYMSVFPNTPLWSSMDYVSFEPKATGKRPNYVCGEYAKYGVGKYPDRFGLWREDISGCTLYPPNPGSPWAVMSNYSDRTGAQMLWHVQDGPTRMNQCGIADTTKAGVMQAALEKGIMFGIRYFEIYGADVKDTSLHNVFTLFSEKLHSTLTDAKEMKHNSEIRTFQLFQNYPNPFNPSTTIRFSLPKTEHVTLKVFDVLGNEITTLVNAEMTAGEHSIVFDAKNLSSGVYFYQLKTNSLIKIMKAEVLK